MTRITENFREIETDYGWIRCPLFDEGHIIGDRRVPSIIEVDFPGAGGQPALYMVIEVINKVPRLTQFTYKMRKGGREIRPQDFDMIRVDDWVETFVAMCAGKVEATDGGGTRTAYSTGAKHVQESLKPIAEARKGSRRPVTDKELRDVAEVYNAQETGGLKAIERVFGFSPSTAARRLRAAKAAGYITEDKR